MHLELCWSDVVAKIEGHKLQFLDCRHPVKTAALGKATLSPYTCSWMMLHTSSDSLSVHRNIFLFLKKQPSRSMFHSSQSHATAVSIW
jgi:hypothetical protein